jgi:hypothetical protein
VEDNSVNEWNDSNIKCVNGPFKLYMLNFKTIFTLLPHVSIYDILSFPFFSPYLNKEFLNGVLKLEVA